MLEEAYLTYKNIVRRKHSISELREARNRMFELYLQLQKSPLSVRRKVPYNIRRHIGKLLSNHKGRERRANNIPSPIKTNRKISDVVTLSYRLRKFQVRKFIIRKAIEMLESPIKALTLPGTEWLFERDLLLTERCEKIVGIECDKNLYKFSQFNLPFKNSNIAFLNKTDEEFFSTPKGERKYSTIWPDTEVKFNLIWLDYMGPFTKNRLTVFEKALQNDFVEDKILFGVTFLKGRENIYTQNLYKETVSDKDEPINKLRSKAITTLYLDIAKKCGYRTKVLDIVEYKEPSGGAHTAPMILILLFLQKGGIE